MSTVRGLLEQIFRQFEASYESINTVELSRSAMLHNFDYLKRLYRADHVIPVLKANAYGHGLESVLDILSEREMPYVAVDGYHEALEVRAVSDFNVLVMGPVLPENFKKVDTRHTAYVIQDMSVLNVLTNLNRHIRIHLEFNTGLNRQGFEPDELKAVFTLLNDNPNIELEGVMTQFYDAANPDLKAVKSQTKVFDDIVAKVKKAGFRPKYIHIAKTSGLNNGTSKYANTIRPGGGLYGINPLGEDHPFFDQLNQLKPVLGLYSRIIKVRSIDKGEGIGYRHSFKAPDKLTTAVLPIGYAEYVPVTLSGKGCFMHKGQPLGIIGDVCMNHTIVDITGTRAKLWDRVEVISRDISSPNSIRQIWKRFNLYQYELLVRISPEIRRVIVN